ncbi:MAG: NAD(P)(+) transhydrogenase (Re/Si-specific) subunit beta [Candidatus Thiodiazotropha lotti]|uniref:NAD(P) transhydrogenase subunit beta n=2 Tax=Candidatus Thiodiazotropha TaxID=1913444 RepID=A0A1E2UU29_9GAMM|nr:NAD(P)(+) transhydrogenase (Re/Si-specific) subunit beta [Candidatus Thiodiazotropha endoloripes]MCG7897363.1 NAD(P)(+) transhydrogenase (Re/Si-specific) subunit beta [Candidatus Thiodiazotropha weberae]MCG7991020.1 NAD(P)(+) transhydrogenase (Re/Si-specific) subunit beta [Candidatus Thiodiazotropha lotti]MCG7902729.1 NAD(P)(+) transhydrogenase (Re/Si-specific) subunit beta [Candidatus Thiodiazotropha weberae]MCG8000997.1 NAD(P)(+) transhydrogenase (Re/Si-specific) subunit beta [Candidatus T
MEISANTQSIAYLISAILFILALKGLTHPASARRGNYLGMIGMAIAILATLFGSEVQSYGFIVAGVAAGALIGSVVASRVEMTAMPQLVAALHSFVGMAAVLVAIGTYLNHDAAGTLNPVMMGELSAGIIIGAITFSGSVVAFAKLQGLVSGAPVKFKGQHMLNAAIGVATVLLGIHFGMTESMTSLVLMTLLAFVLGFTLIIPIGGADMPVIISMLNSYSGWAAAATGFTLGNLLLIIVGALVGFSGAILSFIMCRAMNRSIINVVFGGFGSESGGEASAVGQAAQKGVKSASVDDAIYWMEDAGKVIIVPGYGMAVAQAQHALKEMMELLEQRNVEVKFAIHPVAGRMPGHMNVLLAEADIPYDHVQEMDEVNPEFPTSDVTLVVGANDVVNPAAKSDSSSPIYGMPILDASKSRQVYFLKRSMSPGYSGVDNLLFYQDNTSLIFGDAKDTIEGMVSALKGGGH